MSAHRRGTPPSAPAARVPAAAAGLRSHEGAAGTLARPVRRGVLLGLGAACLAGCSPLRVLNAVSTGGSGHAVDRGEAYGPLDRQRVDVYRPAGTRPRDGFPLVVFFYGGSWSSGERRDYAFVGAALAAHGVLTVVADYRLYPDVVYPAFLEDSALALAWAIEAAGRFGADPKRIFVMGHSAGGYNAAMLALDPRWLGATRHAPQELAGWIGLSGPYDFFPSDDPALRRIFHHPDYPPGGQPIEHAGPRSPPAFLGGPPDDKVVSYTRSTTSLARRLEAAGVPVTLKAYPSASHQTLLGSFAWPLRWAGPVLHDVLDFIRTTPGRA